MKKYFYTVLTILLCNSNLFAQSDCTILVKYTGSIKSNSIKVYQIALPTTPFLDSFITKREERAFLIYKLKNSIIDYTMDSHMSSEFCTSSENIINNVFKKPNGGYLIKLFEKKKIGGPIRFKVYEILVPLDTIQFTTENINGKKEIIINLEPV